VASQEFQGHPKIFGMPPMKNRPLENRMFPGAAGDVCEKLSGIYNKDYDPVVA
jgi:hypothetical protein